MTKVVRQIEQILTTRDFVKFCQTWYEWRGPAR